MAGLRGFPACGFRPNEAYDDSYDSGSESFGRDMRNQRRMFAEFQRQAFAHRLHNQQSSPSGIRRSQSPFSNRARPSPMMGSHPQYGIPSPLGMNMGGGSLGGMGLGMGMGMGMSMGMGSGMGLGMGPGMGRSGGRGCSSRSPFLSGPRMGYGQSSPFGPGHSHRSHPMFTTRNRQNGQPSWRQGRRTPFSTSLFDDDEDDESDYDTSTTYNYPRPRRGGFTQLGRSPYGAQHRPGWMHSHSDRYEEIDHEDDEDDECDFQEYYPVRQRRPRY